jgi:hypothetical protein
MALLTDVVVGVRSKLRDFPKMFQTNIQGDGLAQIFEFPVEMIDATTLVVNQIENTTQIITQLNAGVDYTLDAHNGMIMLAAALPSTMSLNVFGNHYEWVLDADIITEATWWTTTLTQSQEDDFVFANLSTNDPRFELTVRATIVGCLWTLLTEASFDIDVRNPEGIDIPASQRFAQLSNLVDHWQERYDDLASSLNVGIDRIMMTTLRRISLSTGRLVPIYNEQEFDDQATPQRRFPLIDVDQDLFDPPPPPTIPNHGNNFGNIGWSW